MWPSLKTMETFDLGTFALQKHTAKKYNLSWNEQIVNMTSPFMYNQ